MTDRGNRRRNYERALYEALRDPNFGKRDDRYGTGSKT
jgi:hypothetical protein